MTTPHTVALRARVALAVAATKKPPPTPPIDEDDLEDDWELLTPTAQRRSAAGLLLRIGVAGAVLGHLVGAGKTETLASKQQAIVRDGLDTARSQFGAKPADAERVAQVAKPSVESLKRFAGRVDAGEISQAQADAWTAYAANTAYAAFAGERHELAKARGLDTATWVLDAAANHCEDCLGFADGSPYTIDDLPATPGDGSSSCGSACKCDITYSSEGD